MTTVDCIISADYVLTMDEASTVMRDAAIAVLDGRIADIGPQELINRQYTSDRSIGGTKRAIMPGLINTHTHAAMVYMRGLADDLPLKTWLEDHIWPTESRWLDGAFVTDAVELACIEMLKGGITTFCDMYFFEDEGGAVARRMGMRANLGAGIIDLPTKTTANADDCLHNARVHLENFRSDPMVQASVALHSIYTCSPETIKKSMALADEFGVMLQIHLAETEWEVQESIKSFGTTPVMHINNLGLLDRPLLASHCVWLTDEEIALLAEKAVGISHCVQSNMKLASGIAPVPKLLGAGAMVSLGTDGAASNNNLDLLSEMSTVAKLHKAVSNDPTAVDAKTALRMATVSGAQAMGLGAEIGMLKIGMAADLIMFDLNKPHLSPIYDICSHLVYSANSSDIETVMVNGKVLVEGGQVLVADEKQALLKAARWADKIKDGDK